MKGKNFLSYKEKRERRIKVLTILGIILSALFLFSFNFLLAETYRDCNVYGTCGSIKTTTINNNTLNVNGSDLWLTDEGNLDTINSTQFENSGGVLNIVESWLRGIITGYGYITSYVDTIWNITGSKYLYNNSGILDLNETELNNSIIAKANESELIINWSSVITGTNYSHLSNFTDDINATSNQTTNTGDSVTFGDINITDDTTLNDQVNILTGILRLWNNYSGNDRPLTLDESYIQWTNYSSDSGWLLSGWKIYPNENYLDFEKLNVHGDNLGFRFTNSNLTIGDGYLNITGGVICNQTDCFTLTELNKTGSGGIEYQDVLNFTNGANYWNDTYATFNKTYADTLYADISVTGDNSSWNESYADTKYYGLNNIFGFWNDTFALFNKTYADTLYSTIDEPLWTANFTAYNESWSSTYNSTYDGYNNTGLIINWTQSGDNLGNHIATQDLDMMGYNVTNITRLGIGTANPEIDIHIFDNSSGSSAYIVFNNNDTGSNVSRGLLVGTGTDEKVYIMQRELNKDIGIYIDDNGTTREALLINGDEGSVSMLRQSNVNVYNSSSPVCPNSALTDLKWDTEIKDNLGEYSTTTGVFTAKDAGIYIATVGVNWKALNANIDYRVDITTSVGTFIADDKLPTATPDFTQSNAIAVYLTAGQTIKTQCYQTSGGSETIQGGAGYSFFSVVKVA